MKLKIFVVLKLFLFSPLLFAQEFEKLHSLIIENKVTSVEGLLKLLPEDTRSRYVLLFKSRSLHEANPTAPRVLMYDRDAQFILTFNGNPDQKGFRAVETAEFDNQKKEFTYREILFPEPRSKVSTVSFSEPNLEKCIKCHGQPARPIWDTHPLWPGAYGERYRMPLSEKEREDLTQFLQIQPSHPRYRYLANIERFANKETFAPSAKTLYDGANKDSPNEELSRLLSRENMKRIAETIRKSPQFSRFGYTLLASVTRDCGQIDEFVPEEMRPSFRDQWRSFEAQADKKNADQEEMKRRRSLSFDYKPDAASRSEVIALNALCFIAEKGMGLSTRQWTTAFEEGTFDFKSPQSIDSEFELQILAALAPHDDQLMKLFSLRKVSSSEKYCDHLRRQSQKSLKDLATFDALSVSGFRTPSSSRESLPTPSLVRKCIECHDGIVGPDIPFGDPHGLSPLLRGGNYPHGHLLEEILFRLSPEAGSDRMPKRMNLSEVERAELANYFKTLAQPSP